MKITWDTIEGGRVEAGAGVLDISRGALVEDIPASDLSDPYVLLRALALALNTAQTFAPGTGGTAILSGLVAVPAKGTDQARIVATYSAPDRQPGSQVRWVITDDTELAGEHTQMDLIGQPLHITYTPPNVANAPLAPSGAFPGGINTSNPGLAYPFDLNPLRPRRVLDVSGYIIGKPDKSVLDADGCVNDRPWASGSIFKNDPPKRKGAWLCSRVSSSVERPGIVPQAMTNQLYRVEARFTARGKGIDDRGRLSYDRDWSDFKVFHNILGRLPDDLHTPEKAKEIKALFQKEYAAAQDHSVNGVTKVGMYPIYDFQSAFGF